MLAMIGLMLSPTAALAAALDCTHRMESSGMGVAPAPAEAMSAATAHHCHDAGGKASKADARKCAQDCAAMSAIFIALPGLPAAFLPSFSVVLLQPAPARALLAHALPGFERPPRLSA